MKTLSKHTDFSKYMSYTRFFEIKYHIPSMIHNVQEKEGYDVLKGKDDWWRVRGFVNGFNRKRMVSDESMSPYRPKYMCVRMRLFN